jgi:glycine oxidase
VSKNKRYDAIIVGGGIVGLSCAWHAQQRGLDVCVLERGRPGDGATRHAAGMLGASFEAEHGADALLELALRGAAAWPAFADELGLPYRKAGTLVVARDRDEAAELRRRQGLCVSHGLVADWLTPTRCRELEPGLGPCAGGILLPEEAEVDPRAVVAKLVPQLTVVEGEVAEALRQGERLSGVRTSDGAELHAADLVVATGCWGAEWLPPLARPPVRPVKGQILRLRGEPPCERIVGCESVYVIPRTSGEVVVGATVEERGFDTTVTAGAVHELLHEAYRMLPDLAELELVEASAGLRPGSPDNAPIVGRGAVDGLVLATGHYRYGILLAPLTGAAVAALLAGEEPDGWDAFAPARFLEVAA